MNRRELLLGVAGAVATGTGASASPDAVAVVRAAYEASLQADRRKVPLSEESFLAPLSLPLRTLWRVARGHPAPGMPAGPKVHALYGTAVLPGHAVTLARVTLESAGASRATVAVLLTVRGAPRLVRVDLVREDEAWRIANFRYPNDDYVAFLERMMAR